MTEDVSILSTDFLKDSDQLITTLEAEQAKKQKQTFTFVLNNSELNAINQITSVKAGKKSGNSMELYNNTNGNVNITLTYRTYANNNGKKFEVTYTPTTAKLLMLYRWKYTETKSKEIVIPIKEYCELTGSVRHRAKEKLMQDTAILLDLKLTVEYNDKKGKKGIYQANLFESSHLMDDRIVLKCTDTLHDYLKNNATEMIYPLPLLAIPCNEQRNPYVLAVGNKIYELTKMNMYDSNTNKKKESFNIAIRTLLDVCYINGMKKPHEVQEEAKKKGVKARYAQFIQKPFERTIELLEGDRKATRSDKGENLIKITYLDSNKNIIEPKVKANGEYESIYPNFTEFLNGYINVKFLDTYPRDEYNTKKAGKKKRVQPVKVKVKSPKKADRR